MKILTFSVKVTACVAATLILSSFATNLAEAAVAKNNSTKLEDLAEQLYNQCRKEVFEILDFEAAIHTCQEAVNAYQQIQDHQGEGWALKDLGNAYYFLGDSEQALEYQQQALNISRIVSDQNLEAAALNNLANAYSALGEVEQAVSYYKQSINLSNEIDDFRVASIGLINLCNGDFVGEFEYCQIQLNRFESTEANIDSSIQANVFVSFGRLYTSVGQFSKAIPFLRQSIELYRSVGDKISEGTSLNYLGIAYRHLEEYETSIILYQQALEIAIDLDHKGLASITYGNLGVSSRFLGQYAQAVEFQQQAILLYRELGNKEGEGLSLNNLGLAYDALGESQKALDSYQQSLEIVQELEDWLRIGNALHNIGMIYFDLEQYETAANMFSEAIETYNTYLRRPDLPDSVKISIFDTYSRSYRTLLSTLVEMDDVEAALEISEKSKARALVDLLSDNYLSSGASSILNRRDIRRIAQENNVTFVQYSLAGTHSQFMSLLIWVIQPSGNIEFRIVELTNSRNIDLAVDAIDFANGTLYRSSNEPSELTDLISDTRATVDIASSNTTSRVNNVESSEALRELYQILVDPIADFLPDDPTAKVVFIPQDSLFLIPFAALQDRDGSYLIENHTISIAPSIQAFALASEAEKDELDRTSNYLTQNALVVGDPIMPSLWLPDQEQEVQLRSLPGAKIEAEAIGTSLNISVLTGEEATEAHIKQELSSASLIHFATHGLLEYGDIQSYGTSDLPGAIALTPGDGEDGLLTSAEIFEMDLQARLAVLSACDTGRGRITGDGVVGLSRSLMSAGVPSVIVSLWSVPDAPTAELMTIFYQQLQQNPDKAQSLRQAMLITMEQHPNPRDWAAFTLIGAAQ